MEGPGRVPGALARECGAIFDSSGTIARLPHTRQVALFATRRAAPHVDSYQVSMHATDEKHARLLLGSPRPAPTGMRRHVTSYTIPKGSLNFPHAQVGMQFLACSAKLCHFRAPESGWEIVVAAAVPTTPRSIRSDRDSTVNLPRSEKIASRRCFVTDARRRQVRHVCLPRGEGRRTN